MVSRLHMSATLPKMLGIQLRLQCQYGKASQSRDHSKGQGYVVLSREELCTSSFATSAFRCSVTSSAAASAAAMSRLTDSSVSFDALCADCSSSSDAWVVASVACPAARAHICDVMEDDMGMRFKHDRSGQGCRPFV